MDLWRKRLTLGADIEAKVADEITADKDGLHQNCSWRAGEKIVHDP
jgi:hypothetical protein